MADDQLQREIWVNVFTEKSAQSFRDQVLNFVERCGEQFLIPVFIDSYGGSVDSLAKMIETMDSVPNRFVTVASGKAMSCGAVLLSHGDVRYCGQYSRVMIHNIHGVTWGDAYEKEQSAKETMRMQRQFMGLLAKNCGITYSELERQIKESISSKEIWLTPQEAFKFGIIDHIGIPSFTPVLQMAIESQPIKERLTDSDKGVTRRKVKKKGAKNARSRRK